MMILLIVVGIWLLLRAADWREGKPFIKPRQPRRPKDWYDFILWGCLLFIGFVVIH